MLPSVLFSARASMRVNCVALECCVGSVCLQISTQGEEPQKGETLWKGLGLGGNILKAFVIILEYPVVICVIPATLYNRIQ